MLAIAHEPNYCETCCRLLSNHKTLYENHSFSVYPLALPIRAPAGLSRVQSKPLPGRARISYPPARPDLFSPNVVEQAFSEVRQESSKGTIIWLLLSRMPSEIPLPRAARLFYWYRAGPMPQGVSYVHHAILYIRNLMPDSMCVISSASLAYRGGAVRTFTQRRGYGVLRSSLIEDSRKLRIAPVCYL